MQRILLQTTIPTPIDDWGIAAFGRLTRLLSEARGEGGALMYDVTARDRATPDAPDPVLSRLADSDYDQLWLFAVDTGDGLTKEDCAGISGFRRRGGGLLVTRDHMDLGSSVCTLGGVGRAHHFHSQNPESDPERQARDDTFTTEIDWPNYHSGANGDFQEVTVSGPVHPVLADRGAPGGAIRYLPAHPHEGAVSAPADDPSARVIATGRSKVTGRAFNLAVAFEAGPDGGRGIAQSTFHHFCDYNWDPRDGCPSFVSEKPGDGILRVPAALADTHRYMLNAAAWLGGA